MHVNCNSIEKRSPICVLYSRNNVMQRTVSFIAYTKKSTMLSLRVILIRSVSQSGLQITLCLLSSSLGNTVLLHTLFLKYETQILDNVFQSNCSSHAKLLTNLRKIEKPPKIQHRSVIFSALQLMLKLNWVSTY